MSLLYLKALHLIGVIVWFAGLFYLGRLFVYHCEADERPEPESRILKAQFELMEKRLYYGITWPGMCITILFGTAMLMEWGLPIWIHTKIVLVVLLVLYHLWWVTSVKCSLTKNAAGVENSSGFLMKFLHYC